MAANSNQREKQLEAVFSRLTKKELVDLALKLGDIPSPAGHEREVGEFILSWLADNKLNPAKYEITSERFSVTGRIKGEQDGTSLLFNSHMDTWIGSPEDIWIIGKEISPIWNRAWLSGDRIVGSGVVNDKGPMAAFMMAAKAIKESDISLKGDLVLTMVPGEIGMAPVDEYQGVQYVGKGVGSRHLVTHGVVADYALVAEATNFCITWVECGAAYFKVTIKTGEPIYTPYIERPVRLEENPSAIVRATKVIQAIEDWAYQYQEKNRYEFEGGTVIPKVNFGAIRGGLPHKPSGTACICCLYLDIRIPPHKNVVDVKKEMDDLLKRTGIPAESEIYLYRKGYEGQNISQFKEVVEKCHEKLFGKKPGRILSSYTSMWRDINIFNEVGIPSLTFGPSSGVGAGPEETHGLGIEDLYNASKLYAMIALDMCSPNE
jgi:acetylornithine deacetylase/succinyl-diaminopimelate desuccinylase-like protein